MTVSPPDDAAPAAVPGVTSGQILRVLRAQYNPARWIFVGELRTRTGYGDGLDAERYIDAFVMGVWPSEGFRRIAYEVKVSRADWLAELRQPEKHIAGYLLAHEFYIAVAPGVFQEDDLYPRDRQGRITLKSSRSTLLHGAGVLEVQPDGQIRTRRRAVPRQPWPMPEAFLASLLRRVRDQSAEEARWQAQARSHSR